ncbi:hypothetical protein SDC9_95067 [bioreactor metagenome]|uniref:Uncharacterized protein n=1 Tax=bioreactor metagenome TaxID=1076179 RepID=A0A645ABV3_9ZZZZ
MQTIEMVTLDSVTRSDEPLLHGAIPGTTVTLRNMVEGDCFAVEPQADKAFIFLSIDGEFGFAAGEVKNTFAGRHVFIPSSRQAAKFRARKPTRMLCIGWEIPEDGRAEWNNPEREFPYIQEYITSVQYRDKNKSDKTISREMVRQRIVPGFCMGSVESYGYDKVAQHPHPMLDQFFFSFPENDVDVLIDDFKVPMKGDTLLHIPLGSNHGVEVLGDNHMHYIWIDFFLGQAGLDRLDNSHKPTGRMRSF